MSKIWKKDKTKQNKSKSSLSMFIYASNFDWFSFENYCENYCPKVFLRKIILLKTQKFIAVILRKNIVIKNV